MSKNRLSKYVLPYLPYVFLFWLFSKCGEAYRVSPEGDTLRKLMRAIANLNTVMSHPLPSFNPFDLIIGLIGTAAVFCVVLYKKKNAKKWRKDIEYGSAKWGTPENKK